MIQRLFLVITMYCQASSSQFNESQNLPFCYLAGKIKNLSAVKYDGLKLTKILFEFLTFIVRKNIFTLYFLGEKVHAINFWILQTFLFLSLFMRIFCGKADTLCISFEFELVQFAGDKPIWLHFSLFPLTFRS